MSELREHAIEFDAWIRVCSGCTYTTGVFWRDEKGERVKIDDLYDRFLEEKKAAQTPETK